MNIALDYDNTYTADPVFWEEFIDFAVKTFNHNVFIVTARDERYDNNDELTYLYQSDINVYFTRGVAKKWWMEQFGEKVDIWIDDKPEAILNNSSMTMEELQVWREECKKAV